jgi:hypothetical protein
LPLTETTSSKNINKQEFGTTDQNKHVNSKYLNENDESGGLILVTVEILIPAVNSMGCSFVVLFSKSRGFRLTAFNLLPNQKPDKCIFRLCSRL